MLTPTQFANADAFLQRAQVALLENEVANSLMLGISMRLRAYPERIQAAPFLFTIESQPRCIDLAAVMTPPHNLILHCAAGCHPDALEVLANHLIANRWAIPGVIGALPGSQQFAECWAQHTGCKVHLHQNERAFELRKVIPPQQAPGFMRLAEIDDLPTLAEWMRLFIFEAMHDEMSLDLARENTAMRIEDRMMYVWDTQGPVSMAAVGRPTPHSIAVSYVYTPPRQRGRGYASNCVAALSQRMLDEGYQFCTLFTDLANPTSNDIYQRIGYRPIIDLAEYRFENH